MPAPPLSVGTICLEMQACWGASVSLEHRGGLK